MENTNEVKDTIKAAKDVVELVNENPIPAAMPACGNGLKGALIAFTGVLIGGVTAYTVCKFNQRRALTKSVTDEFVDEEANQDGPVMVEQTDDSK